MSSSRKREGRMGRCWDCGETGPVPQDGHVIPSNLFPHGERPHNLVTFPECGGCNQGASKDEEYFLVAILAPGTLRSPAAQRRLAQLRNPRRNRAGLARRFLRAMEPLPEPVEGVDGRLSLEVSRAERVLRRIVRGLYRHEFQAELPPDHPMVVHIEPPPEVIALDVYQFVAALPEHVYGDRVFSYRFRRSSDGTRSAWLLSFYDAFSAFILEPLKPSVSDSEVDGRQPTMDRDDHDETTVGKLLQATFGLWNALLTVNGIMLTVFTAVYAIAPAGGTSLVRLLITCCVVSVCLLLFNHAATKATYHRMGEVDSGPPLTDSQRERDVRRSLWRHGAVRVSENLSMLLTVVEVILVVAYTYSLPPR